MLFRRDIEPHCAYCEHAQQVESGLRCARRGDVTPEQHCHAFRYDPLKRMPPRPASLKIRKFRKDDFSL